MAAPWEKYQRPEGPWAKYRPRAEVAAAAPPVDPTEGMGRGEKFAAGLGQSAYDAFRRGAQVAPYTNPLMMAASLVPGDPAGVRRNMGLVQEGIDEAAKLDAPLLDDGWGKGGAITGQVLQIVAPGWGATRIPSLAGAGNLVLNPRSVTAAQGIKGLTGGVLAAGGVGAADAALTEPVASGESELGAVGQGFAWGAAGQGLGELIGAAGRPVYRLLTRGRQADATAGAILRESAADPRSIAAIEAGQVRPPVIPGSLPTTAEAVRDPGLAGLERVLRTKPEFAPQFVERDAARNAARVGLVERLFNGATLDDAARIRGATADAQGPVIRDAMKATGAETGRVIASLDRVAKAPRFVNAPAAQDAIAKVRGLLVTPLDDAARLSVGREMVKDALESGRRMSSADFEKLREAARLVRGASVRGESADDVAKGLLKIKPSSKTAMDQIRGIARAMSKVEKGKDDVASLYNARKYITSTLMPSADSEAMFAYRGAVKKLDEAIVDAAPTFKDYLRDYAAGMRQADQAAVGAKLLATGQPRPSDPVVPFQLGAKTVRATENLDQVVRGATGFGRARAENVLTPQQIQAARDIARDIDSYAWVLQQSRASVNSITPESLAGQGRLGAMAREAAANVVPGGNFTVATVDSVLNQIGAKQGQRVQQIVAEAMLNPQRAAEILAVLPPDVRSDVIRIAGPTLGQIRLTTTGAFGLSGAAAAEEEPAR